MPTLVEVADQIQEVHTRLSNAFKNAGWPTENPLNSYQSYLPGYSADVILDHISYTAERVRALTEYDLGKNGLGKYLAAAHANVQLLTLAGFTSDPNTNLNGIMMTMHMINARLPTESKGPVKLDWESIDDKSMVPKDLSRRLGGIAARLASLEPRASQIDKKISDIEAAHETAEQLPEDLAELASKRDEVSQIVSDVEKILAHAQKISASIDSLSDESSDARKRMAVSEEQAVKLIDRSEQALRGSTGVGLANAFEKRKESLSKAGTIWVGGLVLALLAALLIGAYRVNALQTVLNNDSPSQIVWMNVILTVFGIGGPVWFAWLSTKQIAVTFRLAEDYAFKAAVSKAYEGYRSEAISIDPALQERLFSSALDRFEESPIRLMEKETHSSPLQELLANPAIRKSLEAIPGIADKIIALIPEKGGVAAVVGSAAAVSAVVSGETAAPAKSRVKKTEEE